MKILYTNHHSGPTIGGHTVYIASLLRNLSVRHRLSVAVPSTSGLSGLVQKMPDVQMYEQNYPSRFFAQLQWLKRLRRLLNEQDFDVIHVNGSSDHRMVLMALAGRIRARPRVVYTKHNDLQIGRVGATWRSRIGTDHVIGVCDFVGNLLHRSPYAARPISVIANGVDTLQFTPPDEMSKAATRCQLLGDRAAHCQLLIGSQAGTDDYKGWMDMVRAVAALGHHGRGIYIVLAGAMPSSAQRALLQDYGMQDRVVFTGPLLDVREFVAALDVGFVLSYRVETISFSCREMMAMGKPVIVSRHAGLPENVTSEVDGWVVPARSPASVEAVLDAILARPERLVAMGQAAREKSERLFCVRQFADRTEQVYLNLLAPTRLQ